MLRVAAYVALQLLLQPSRAHAEAEDDIEVAAQAGEPLPEPAAAKPAAGSDTTKSVVDSAPSTKVSEKTAVTPAVANGGHPSTSSPYELQLLRERIERLERAQSVTVPAPNQTQSADSDGGTPAPVDERPTSPFSRVYPIGVKASGYVQAQYERSQLSEDQLTQSGAAYNGDRFSVARARLRLDYATRWAATSLELEGTSARGTVVSVRRAEVGWLWRTQPTASPVLALQVGIFDVPFGYELVNPHRVRWFVERSAGSTALFPVNSDAGIKLSGAPGFVRYHLAFINGQPFDDLTRGSLIDPNAAKDFVGRLGLELATASRCIFSGGVSFLEGRGFHAGSPATKNSSVWQDTNENGRIDTGEVVGLPGRAATPSSNFEHWALGLDFQLRIRSWLGWGELAVEGFVASNLDRGSVVADPVLIGTDTRELGFYVALTQQVTRYGVLGFRYDYYDPNADFVLARAGRLLPATQTVQTFSPLLGATLPGRIRVIAQYDFVRDHFGRDTVGVPADLANNRLTLRLQGEI